jgi:hypothetical protein
MLAEQISALDREIAKRAKEDNEAYRAPAVAATPPSEKPFAGPQILMRVFVTGIASKLDLLVSRPA